MAKFRLYFKKEREVYYFDVDEISLFYVRNENIHIEMKSGNSFEFILEAIDNFNDFIKYLDNKFSTVTGGFAVSGGEESSPYHDPKSP